MAGFAFSERREELVYSNIGVGKMNKMKSGLGFLGLVCLLVLVPIQATAENEPTALDENRSLSEDWQYSLRPYFYLSGLSGSISVESVTFPINSSFSTLLDNVKIGGFVSITAEKGQWGVNADFQYINLYGESTEFQGTSLDLKNIIGELDLIFRPEMAPTLRFLAGLRAYSVSQNILLAGRTIPEAKTTVLDPVLGAFGAWTLNENWNFELKGDFGGFGISSERTYQLMGAFRFELGENTSVPFGYRVLGYQIKSDSVRMNIQMAGTFLGLDYHF